MSTTLAQPRLTKKGVAFSVVVDCIKRDCLITLQALNKLAALKNADANPDIMEIFRAYEASINGVARRLVAAGVTGTPLIMRPETFGSPVIR